MVAVLHVRCVASKAVAVLEVRQLMNVLWVSWLESVLQVRWLKSGSGKVVAEHVADL